MGSNLNLSVYIYIYIYICISKGSAETCKTEVGCFVRLFGSGRQSS